MKLRVQWLAFVLAVLSAALPARAVVLVSVWSATPTDGVFGNAINWDVVPGVGAAVVFTASSQSNVSFATAASLNSITIDNRNGTFPAYTFSTGNGSTLTLGTGGMTVATGGATSVTFDASLPIVLGAAQTWDVGNAVYLNVNGVVSGTNALTKTGGGSLVLSGANTYSGGTTIAGGYISIAADSALGTAPASPATNLTFSGGNLATSATLALNANRSITVNSNANFDVASGTTLTIPGAITGLAGIDINPLGGTLELSGNNTFSGAVTVHNGGPGATLKASNASALGSTAGATIVQAGSTLEINNVAIGAEPVSVGGVGAAGTGALLGTGTASLSGPVTLLADTSIGGTGNLTLSGAIGQTGGTWSLTKDGTGTLALSGANTYGGATTIKAGTLQLGANNSLPSTTALAVAPALASTTATFDLNGKNQTLAGLALGGASSSTANVSLGAGTLTLAGNLTFDGSSSPSASLISGTGSIDLGAAARTFNIGDSASVSGPELSIVPALIGTGASVNKTGAGLLEFQGANTYTSGTTISAGGLVARNASGSATGTGNVTINSGALLQIGVGTTTGSVSGAITNNGGITFNRSDAISYTGISGSGSVTQMGTGTLTLTGTNSYTGSTSINAGTLADGAANGFSPSSRILFNAASTNLNVGFNDTVAGLSGTGTNGAVSLASGATLSIANGGNESFGGVISGAGSITKSSGSGTQTLSGANTFTGGVSINAGQILVSSDGNLGATSGGLTLNNGVLLTNSTFTLAPTRAVSVGGSGGGMGVATGTTLTFGGVISGTGTFTKYDNGTLILSGANTYTGATNVVAGTLVAANAGALGTTAGGTTVANGQTLSLSNVGIGAEPLSLAGTGVGGTGALYATGASSFAGALTLTGGPTSIGVNTGDSLALSGAVGSSTGFGKVGMGTLTLAPTGGPGVNTYTGNTNINAGTLSDGAAGSYSANSGIFLLGGANSALKVNFNETINGLGGLSSSTGSTTTIATGATLTIKNANLTYQGTISGNGAVATSGIGNQTLQGANTYLGGTILGGGTLTVTNPSGSATGSGAVTVNGGASLQIGQGGSSGAVSGSITNNGSVTFNRSDTIAYSGVISGSGSLMKTGPGILALGAANTYTGQTFINNGTLRVDVTNAIPTASPLGMNFGTTIDITAGQSQTLQRLNGAFGGNIQVGTSSVLTLAPQASDGGTTFEGTINGAGALQIQGAPGTFVYLTGANNYAGGTQVTSGSLWLGAQNGGSAENTLGSGPITIGANGGLAAVAEVTLTNAVSVADGTTFGAGQDSDTLTLAGNFTLTGGAESTTNLHLLPESRLLLAGSMSAPLASTLNFDSGGIVVLAGSVSSNLYAISANGAAVIFVSPQSVPANLSVQSLNNGYIGLGVTSTDVVPTPLTAAALMARIPNKATFDGTFGFDTDMDRLDSGHVFTEPLDFSGFTGANFAVGSHTAAVLAGEITPPGTNYAFGNGGGMLAVQSNLTGVRSVSVDSNDEGLKLVLRGNNTFTGNVTVVNSGLLLDSTRALPSTASINVGGFAYVGSTEAFSSAANFVTLFHDRVQPLIMPASEIGPSLQTLVLGLDSQVVLNYFLPSGRPVLGDAKRIIPDNIDLSTLDYSSLYLGTMTNVQLTGTIKAPVGGVLSLMALEGGEMIISSALSSTNVSSVQIGSTSGGDSKGVVQLSTTSTYTGPTVLSSGTLRVGSSGGASGSGGPVGTSNLIVNGSEGDSPALSSASTSGITVGNPVILNSDLQLGEQSHHDRVDNGSGIDPASARLTLSGPISGSGGLIAANGLTTLSGTNSYSGFTYAFNGGLVFANSSAIPAGTTLVADFGGYLGISFVPANLSTDFLDRFSKSSTSGTIGFDGGISVGAVDLTGFSNPRLGSTTSATITGTITTGGGGSYQFGGGGGTLAVSSALTNNGTSPRGVFVQSPFNQPLTLRLTSTGNTYTASTSVSGSAVIFGAGALPGGTSNFSLSSDSYIGTEDTSGPGRTSFFSHFFPSTGTGVIGFDSTPGSGTPYTISGNLDLTYFTGLGPNFAIGSTTSLLLTSAASITLPTFNTGYRFAGYKGGLVQVDFPITSGSVKIGVADSPATQGTSSVQSRVVLTGSNTYAGGTTLYAGALGLGSNSSLGSGKLTVPQQQFGNDESSVRIYPFAGSRAIANNIDLGGDLTVDTIGTSLTLSGVIADLAGAVGDPGEIYKENSGTLTLSGHNTFSGGIYVSAGNLTLVESDSAGTGPLRLGGPLGPSVTFLADSTINGLEGDNSADAINIGTSRTLAINQVADGQYAGSFSSAAATILYSGPNASQPTRLRLTGSSSYNGGTQIGSGVMVIAANSNAFGPGTTAANIVTLNGGKLAVDNVTLSNPLVLTNGALGGVGTFQPRTTLTIGNNVTLAPGFSAGTLVFDGSLLGVSNTLVLAGGGSYEWEVADPNANGAWDLISVTGTVSITAGSATPFNFKISSPATSLTQLNLNPTQNYSWKVLTATSITGFTSSAQFAVQLAPGAFGSLPTANFGFSLAADGANQALMLNFTAVPEPSTYAMIALGLGAVTFTLRRRRSP